MTGGLFDPLGTGRAEPVRTFPVLVVLAGLAAVALIALLGISYLRDDGDRGRPVAVAPIEHASPPPKPPATPPPPPTLAVPPPVPGPTRPAGLPAVRGDEDVEVQNGVRIIRPRRSTPGGGGETIPVPTAPIAR